jgi:ABC-type transport system involved in multi-copper enzyme maturation permease subunit
MWIIAKISVKEILYKRIFIVIFLMSFAFLCFYGIGTYYAGKEMASSGMGNIQNVLANNFFATQFLGIGLYFAAFITSLLAIFSSVGSLSREIESRQIESVLCRALPRHSFVLGKLIGLGGILLLFAAFLFAGVLLINQWFGGQLRVDLDFGQLMQASGLFLLRVLILAAVSLAFSARISTLNSGIIMIMLYIISMIGGFIEQFGAVLKKQVLIDTGIVISLIFPLDSVFRKMMICLFDSSDNPISFVSQGLLGSMSVPSDLMIIYACLYGLIALGLAIRSFAARDI